MDRLLVRLKPYGWNEKVFTWEDFEYFCRLDEINVFYCRVATLGEYFIHNDLQVICLDRGLKGGMKIWVAYHELAHAWLHEPGAGSLDGAASKLEHQADVISSCALVPQPLLRTVPAQDIIDEYGYPEALLWLRKEVFDRHGL